MSVQATRCAKPAPIPRARLGRPEERVHLIILLIVFFLRTAWAVNPATHISQYGRATWRIQDGYFHGRLQAVAQTTDGYLWVGTEAGLLRFDGVNFVPWTPPTGQQLRSSSIRSLHGSADGSLWIGTTLGVSRLRNNNLTNFGLRGPIGSILEDSDSSVWLVYASPDDTPLCHIVETTVRCYDEKNGIPKRAGGDLIHDAAGNIWLSAEHGIVRWRPDSFSVYNASALRSLEGEDGVEDIAFGPGHSILVGMAMRGRGLGLQQFMTDSGAWWPYRKAGLDGTTLKVARLFVDREGALWIGTFQQGMFRVQEENVEHFGSADGLSGDFIRDFYEDREGNLWVITSKGVDLFRDLKVLTFSPQEGLGTGEVESVLASRNGTVWVGGDESLDAIRFDGIFSIRTGKGLPGVQVREIFEDHAGRLWVGVDQNLYIYKERTFKPITRGDGSPVGAVRAIAEDGHHNIWVSTQHGSITELLRVRDFKVEEELWSPQVPPFRQIAADPNGNLWLATSSGSLARLNNGHTEIIPFEEIKDSPIEQLIVASDGSVLGATASGVIAWKNNSRRILTAQDGLPCNGAHGLLNDALGNLWLNMQCGLVEVTNVDLKRWWEKSDSLHPRVFDSFDGAQAGRAFWNSAARSTDGRLWFANGTVLQMIDPSHLALDELAPPVHVERIMADRRSYSVKNGLIVPPLTRDLEIDYAALSFGVPQKVRFRYKLEERDTDWIEAATRRQAFYSDLRPGHYRFRVIACNQDGVWNEAGASLNFSILPAYYQTYWFRALCVATFLVLLWAAYRIRVRQLRQKFVMVFDARVNERTRIARELHDTLLQSFHGLLLSFQRAANLLPERPVEAKQRLEAAIDQAARAVTEGREAVQGLRSSAVATNDLAVAIQAVGDELAAKEGKQNSLAFGVAVEGTQRDLNPILRDDVYRIAGEAVRNAFQHAQARHIEVEIHYSDRQLRVRIRDDGRGVDTHVLSDKGRSGHWGLPGMRERAKLVGGELEIWSQLDSGTEIELRIPASIAYQTSAQAQSREKMA